MTGDEMEDATLYAEREYNRGRREGEVKGLLRAARWMARTNVLTVNTYAKFIAWCRSEAARLRKGAK